MKAFIFVNDNASAYKRYKKKEIPSQFVYGISQLEKMEFDIKVSTGSLLKDLWDFAKFKPDLFFMPFTKRKTILYFMIAKLFGMNTRFVGWIHLDIFSAPNGRWKKIIHSRLLPLIVSYVKKMDAIFFLSPKTMSNFVSERGLNSAKCHFVPWGGDADFYREYLTDCLDGNIISTGRENRDLPLVIQSLRKSLVAVDIYTSDKTLPDVYDNLERVCHINKGFWPYSDLLEKVSTSKAMIIPLKMDKINYCVGLSSLIEAISLGRPVITTYNPYWYIDIEVENIGIVIHENTHEEWKDALELLEQNDALVQEMSNNALRLFEKKCDFSITERLISEHISKLF
jgi:glycosyltransferase involved in cell wall biosynthesis